MKKFNYNSLVFIFFIIFVFFGIYGKCFNELKDKSFDFAKEINSGKKKDFSEFTATVDDISNKKLSYHKNMMDINSIKDNLIGTRIVQKEDVKVVKSNSGSLCNEIIRIPDEDISCNVTKVEKLNSISKANGSNFLYCFAPTKENYEKLPENVENYSNDNSQRFLNTLKARNIPYLDFSDMFKSKCLKNDGIYFYTDHHWTPKTGFSAAGEICKELNKQYGFEYNMSVSNIENYNVKTYKNWFLGSKGKKVGTYFTFRGADDFDYITPKFKTNLIETQPIKNITRTGDFKNTVLYTKNLKKNYYDTNCYATYSGGDFRLQIIKNNLNPKGKKILLIKDSFACAVIPFLSLQTGELHICDIRDMGYFVGDKVKIDDYIKKIKPDYVIVLYSGITDMTTDGKYEFF